MTHLVSAGIVAVMFVAIIQLELRRQDDASGSEHR